MEIWNQTRGVRLASQVELAQTFFTRLRGWMGRSSFPEGAALVISPCNSIHTWFMKSPIDVLFVDREHRVVQMLQEIPPYQISRIVRGATYVIELPPGTLAASGTECEDVLQVVDGTGKTCGHL